MYSEIQVNGFSVYFDISRVPSEGSASFVLPNISEVNRRPVCPNLHATCVITKRNMTEAEQGRIPHSCVTRAKCICMIVR